jgi:hypothetical protein
MKHPIQPLAKDKDGVVRFKPNAIVQHLLDKGGIDLNQLAVLEFSQEDREQFAQLIGYSLRGFGELSYVSDETYTAAEAMSKSKKVDSDTARIKALEATLEQARAAVREAATALFRIHPDDLHT